MCRVLGITNFDWSIHRPLVERFSRLALTGVVMAEDPPGHQDGWGLACYRQGLLVVHKSGVNLLEETERVFGLLEAVRTAPLLILHLRKSAWADTSSTRHAHPFFQGSTVFFHNGVVYDYPELIPAGGLPGLPADARDTEVFFHHILSRSAPDLGRRFLASAAAIREHHRFSALNCLFSDGAMFYAYREYAREPDYYALFKARAGTSRLVSSEPLDPALRWEPMAQGELLEIALADSRG